MAKQLRVLIAGEELFIIRLKGALVNDILSLPHCFAVFAFSS